MLTSTSWYNTYFARAIQAANKLPSLIQSTDEGKLYTVWSLANISTSIPSLFCALQNKIHNASVFLPTFS